MQPKDQLAQRFPFNKLNELTKQERQTITTSFSKLDALVQKATSNENYVQLLQEKRKAIISEKPKNEIVKKILGLMVADVWNAINGMPKKQRPENLLHLLDFWDEIGGPEIKSDPENPEEEKIGINNPWSSKNSTVGMLFTELKTQSKK